MATASWFSKASLRALMAFSTSLTVAASGAFWAPSSEMATTAAAILLFMKKFLSEAKPQAGLADRQSLDRAFLRADGDAGDRFDLGPRLAGVLDPVAVELVGAFRHALVTVAGVDQAGVAAVQQ